MIASVLGETEYDASVSIEEQSEVLLLPIPTFKDWVEAYRPIKQFVYKQIMGRVTDVAKLLERVAFRSIPYRLADYLLSQAQFAQNNVIRLTHEQLSIEIGTAREVLGRTLKNFADLGAIALGRGQINLLDRDTLREIAERHL
jgi:CRP/FNR family transcriptional regulator